MRAGVIRSERICFSNNPISPGLKKEGRPGRWQRGGGATEGSCVCVMWQQRRGAALWVNNNNTGILSDHVGPRCSAARGPGCNMLRQIVYSPLSLLAAALRIDKNEQRMSALYCCDLNGEMSKQTVGVGRLQDASQESTFKPNTHEKNRKPSDGLPSAHRTSEPCQSVPSFCSFHCFFPALTRLGIIKSTIDWCL